MTNAEFPGELLWSGPRGALVCLIWWRDKIIKVVSDGVDPKHNKTPPKYTPPPIFLYLTFHLAVLKVILHVRGCERDRTTSFFP